MNFFTQLTKPHNSIIEESQKRLAKLIISITLLLTFIVSATEILFLTTGAHNIYSTSFLIMLVIFVFLIITYILSKRKNYKLGLMGIIFINIIGIILMITYNHKPETYLIQFYFISAIIIAKLIFNLKKQFLLLLLIVSIIITIPIIFSNISFSSNIRDIFLFITINGLIIILIEKFSQLQEESRQKKLIKLNSALQNEKKELIKTTKAKNVFFNILSHNLRTPLSRSRWSIELLKEDKNLSSKTQADIDIIYNNILDINKVFNIMFNFSEELGSKSAALEHFPIQNIVIDLQKKYSKKLNNKKIHIKITNQKEYVLHATKKYLINILDEYLKNAVFFTKEGNIIIELKEVKNKKIETKNKTIFLKNHLIISVTDPGKGILAKDQDKIFKTQYKEGGVLNQKDSTDTTLGLGLTFVNILANKSNINIWFTSIQGKGSTFFTSIPISTKK